MTFEEALAELLPLNGEQVVVAAGKPPVVTFAGRLRAGVERNDLAEGTVVLGVDVENPALIVISPDAYGGTQLPVQGGAVIHLTDVRSIVSVFPRTEEVGG